MHRLARWLVAAGVLSVAVSAPAFSQRTLMTSVGHEAIIVAASGAIQAGPKIDASLIACRHCDLYGTEDWRIYSAVVGNRWADMAGYNVLQEVAHPLTGKADCFDSVVQDAQAVQYQHGLRTWADVGPEGNRRTHEGTRTVIWDRFYRGVREPENPMWVRDGGLRVHFVKVDRPYFFLGMALHALQDTFSTEHAQRNWDWSLVNEYKTYVGTPGAQSHAMRGQDKAKYSMFGLLPQPTPLNGDFIFVSKASNLWTVGPGGNVKASAEKARDASYDLMTAFEGARARPAAIVSLWSAFESKWLTFDPPRWPSGATQDAAAPPLPPKLQKTEDDRGHCLDAATRNPELRDYPPFCWPMGPNGPCAEDYPRLEAAAGGEALRALNVVRAELPSSFAAVPQRVEDPKDRSAATLGSRAGDEVLAAALQEVDRFFLELGDSFSMLNEAERRRAVDARWGDLLRAVADSSERPRDAACARARQWPGTEDAREAAEARCRAEFDAEAPQRKTCLDGYYDANLILDLVKVQVPTVGAAPAAADAAYAAPLSTPSPAEELLRAPAKPVAPRTADDKRRDLYQSLHRCIDDPMNRILDPLGHEGACREAYREGLRSQGLN